MIFEHWEHRVDAAFESRTGCNWQDLCGDMGPLKRAYDRGETPEEFVSWWIAKYDLIDKHPAG